MNVRWSFRRCDRHKNEIREFWEAKSPRLERLLSRYPADQRRLDLTLSHFEARNEWDLRAVLRLPTGTLVTQEAGADRHGVVDKVVEELSRQVQRHKAEVRNERQQRRRRRQRANERAAVQFLQSDVQRRRPAAFFELLKPLMSTVQSHAALELEILELEGEIPMGEVTFHDLTDDVLVAAWESFEDRPHHAPIHVWLLGILHERLAELQQAYGDIKLSSPVAHSHAAEGSDMDPDDLGFWLSQALDPPEQITLEDVLAVDDPPAWWHDVQLQEQHDIIMDCLKRLPKQQRHAFMLSVVEGFDLSEIAMVLDRSEAEIEREIDQARLSLRTMVGERQIAVN